VGFEDKLCLGKGTRTVHTDRGLFISIPEGYACDIHEVLGYLCKQCIYMYVIFFSFLRVFVMISFVVMRETTQERINHDIGEMCRKLARHYIFYLDQTVLTAALNEDLCAVLHATLP
jgi:hypothetical protein